MNALLQRRSVRITFAVRGSRRKTTWEKNFCLAWAALLLIEDQLSHQERTTQWGRTQRYAFWLDIGKLIRAFQLASTTHGDQKDKSDAPYMEHVTRVARAVETKVPPELRDHAVTVAYLHDVVEDTRVTLDCVRNKFGSDVADDEETLTHRPGEDYPDYINRVARGSATARAVKLADLEDHLRDTSHIGGEQVKKYRDALGVLTGSHSADPAG